MFAFKTICVSIAILLPNVCQAQLCAPHILNSQNITRPLYSAADFIKLNENHAFRQDDRAYAELYVKLKALNVRNGASSGDILGVAFRGQKLSIYAKYGDWVAIKRRASQRRSENQFWLHSGYLSSERTQHAVEEDLLSRCSLSEMVKMLDGQGQTNGCKSVRKYIVWEYSLSALSYKKSLEEYLRSRDSRKTYQRLNSCSFPFF